MLAPLAREDFPFLLGEAAFNPFADRAVIFLGLLFIFFIDVPKLLRAHRDSAGGYDISAAR
jgi:hypothetical protein